MTRQLATAKHECSRASQCAAACCTLPCGSRVCSMLGCQGGDSVRVHRVDDELSCGQRLAELGIIEGAELTVLKQSDPVLLLSRETRIAIDRHTAARIEVAYAAAV
jgi:Fe2+ transport system protein FeoA